MQAVDEDCPWLNIFNDNDRTIYKNGLIWSATAAAIMGCLTNAILLRLKDDPSYLNFSFFTMTAFMRRTIYLLYHFLQLYDFDLIWSPQLLAFFETFMAVLEIETLTHACIERYVMSKYILRGSQPLKEHYNLFVRLSLFFATLYSVLPLLEFGSYDYDFECETYTFNMILPKDWTEFLIVSFFWMRSIKPAFFMIIMLRYCKHNEANFVKTPENLKQMEITRSVTAVAFGTMLSYTPICIIRGRVILKQLARRPLVAAGAKYIIWASWLHWVSPALTTLILFALNQQFNDVFLNFINKLIPCSTKRINLVTEQEANVEKTD